MVCDYLCQEKQELTRREHCIILYVEGLTGDGLIRSAGGWGVLKSLRRMNIHFKSDERILGDSDFVERVLCGATEKMERRYRLEAMGYDFDTIVKRVPEIFKGHS